jgi:hypothetical protein
MSRTGLWKPCAFARPISPNSGPGSPRHLGGDPREHGVDIAPDLRERIGDPHESGIAHLFQIGLRRPADRSPCRDRASPRVVQRSDIALERGKRVRR